MGDPRGCDPGFRPEEDYIWGEEEKEGPVTKETLGTPEKTSMMSQEREIR